MVTVRYLTLVYAGMVGVVTFVQHHCVPEDASMETVTVLTSVHAKVGGLDLTVLFLIVLIVCVIKIMVLVILQTFVPAMLDGLELTAQ